jgi:Flp pilus assembly CpaE family ATPase
MSERVSGVEPLDNAAFNGLGPLLAVCGLCGGAGATTLAYLVARHCARDTKCPILVCDTGGPSAGLAAYAGVESPRSLTGVADALADGDSLAEGVFVEVDRGLRVVTRRPGPDGEYDQRSLRRVLCDAREAHALTVVDCGTLTRSADLSALAAATHIAWVVPATESALTRARRIAAAPPRIPGRPELIVARRDMSETRAPTSDLKQLATDRGAALVLAPHVPDIVERPVEEALEKASVTLVVIEGALRR